MILFIAHDKCISELFEGVSRRIRDDTEHPTTSVAIVANGDETFWENGKCDWIDLIPALVDTSTLVCVGNEEHEAIRIALEASRNKEVKVLIFYQKDAIWKEVPAY